MRQLWLTGWMPRGVRLLVAACLVEGLGLDWRLGRDWFALTLIDHDFAINEAMWQNAGLCGIDPFYRGLRWEISQPNELESYADYIKEWLNVDLHWPAALEFVSDGVSSFLPLRAAAHEPRPPSDQVAAFASMRRVTLRRAFRAAGKVSMAGVRVDFNGGTGETLAVGRQAAADVVARALGSQRRHPDSSKGARS